MIKKLSYFTYESLPVYTMVTSLVLDGNVLQFFLVNPTFAITDQNHMMAFSKFAKAKFALQLRLSAEIDQSDETLKIKRWASLGLTYEELSQLLYPDLLPGQEFAICNSINYVFEQNTNKNNCLESLFIENVDQDKQMTYIINADQHGQMKKQIEKSLTWIAGWHHPKQFIKQLEVQKPIN
ncbi:unnamed protein product (macronuclear) [Paramecium tetraurelia]|uniref:Uncharacterized protein n=1 Tax=Paramecium tetraurelia TaxID=5888 RepID=A0EF66_PARTE|nr:uncharacterized protein GSPATT00026280001 [Paramecium tetraurelia]CAK93957.1 unnamed protein product [Paramecium tetraurelia]|eukprot:XP_001461330.1 hypothetical protein (macronuclear) [Paramecium tetraurelia strain d4-2]